MKRSALAVSCWLLATSALAEETWYLTSRHGECTSITATMRHKLQDFPEVATPQAFVLAMKERGLEVELTVPPNGMEGLLLAKVPAREWTLLMIRRDRCSSFSTGPK